ncbi:MAG TPA: hypothetical protein VKB92_13335 [Myxococcales bacterium]|nr:hypothetical protein [Myxococcales bacterium]
MSTAARKRGEAPPSQLGFTLYLREKTPGLCTCHAPRIRTGNGSELRFHAPWCALPSERHEERLR